MVSEKISIIKVRIIEATAIAFSPPNLMAITEAIAEAKILTKLLPKSIILISSSNFCNKLKIILALKFYFLVILVIYTCQLTSVLFLYLRKKQKVGVI